MKNLKVLTLAGTRPEIIRLSCIIKKFDPMKTINLKNTSKVLLILFLLFSTNSFSFTKFPTKESSIGHESRTCFVSKAKKTPKTTAKAYSKTSKSFAMKSKSKKIFKK